MAGCETPTNGLTEAAKTAAAIGHINPSKNDTCETQRQAAAQSSRIDTIKTGKEVVYVAADPACTAPGKPVAVASARKP